MTEWVEVFMPGRLCLFGEHTDWAAAYRIENPAIEKGYALVLGLDLGVYLKACKSDDFKYSYEDKQIILEKMTSGISSSDPFFDYVVASIKIVTEQYKIGGATIICQKMTLPIKKGLASSAAICMAIIRVLNRLYDLNISIEEEMELAYNAEISIGSKCGRLDQLCAYGQGIRLAVFDGDTIKIDTIQLNQELYYVLVDLNGKKNTKKILDDLNSVYPYAQTNEEKLLFAALGTINKGIVNKAILSLIEGDIHELGRIMYDAQNKFDKYVAPYSNQLIAPKLHYLMEKLNGNPYVLGMKGVGSQGDGMAQILVKDEAIQYKLINEIEEMYGFKCISTNKKSGVLNAIIPIAGYGTRMMPYTEVVDKAYMPIYSQGKIYPAIYLILDELDKAGITQVDLVIRSTQNEMVEKIKALICNKMQIQITTSMQGLNGFGGAISSSTFLDQHQFSLVCLGDYIYKGEKVGACTKQLINIWDKYKSTIISIKEIDKHETKYCGVVQGEWIQEDILRIKRIVEKPSPEYAEQELSVNVNGEKKIFGIFGEYIIDNKILKKIRDSNESNEEIGLTEFLNEAANQEPMYAVVISGDSYDLGNPLDYYKSFVLYGKE